MKAILVPTNFTASSKNAVEYAAQLCKAWNSKLILLNVFMLPVPVSEFPYMMESTLNIQDEYEKTLALEAARIFQLYGIQTEHLVEQGMPELDIVDIAEEKNVDLIIMGMKEMDGLEKILGNTVNGVVRKSSVPVLVIPGNAVYKKVNTLAYATDFSYDMNKLTFVPVKTILDSFKATLHIVHVKKQKDIVTQAEIADKVRLAMVADDAPYKYTTIEDDSVEHGLEKYLSLHPADILVMVAHKHNFFERLFGRTHTKTMLYKTDIPLLVLHD